MIFVFATDMLLLLKGYRRLVLKSLNQLWKIHSDLYHIYGIEGFVTSNCWERGKTGSSFSRFVFYRWLVIIIVLSFFLSSFIHVQASVSKLLKENMIFFPLWNPTLKPGFIFPLTHADQMFNIFLDMSIGIWLSN